MLLRWVRGRGQDKPERVDFPEKWIAAGRALGQIRKRFAKSVVRPLIPIQTGPDSLPTKRHSSNMRRIKSLLCRAAGVPRNSVVTVAELRCSDPGCPEVETVLGLFLEGRDVRRYRVAKPISGIREEDIVAAVRAEGAWSGRRGRGEGREES